jgi:hypothetical protein
LADLIAERDPRTRRDHGMTDLDPIGGQSRHQAPDEFDRVGIDRGR